jgi:spermidine synthase
MSALKLDDPFDLSPTPYNQAMMLTLLWRDTPERIYVAGFAGGRIPLMFYHYFPAAVVDSTDIDAEVEELAKKYFGIQYDDRQRLFLIDGRTFLENLKESKPYDIIFVDVFRGMGFSPPHLATADFYRLCKKHLRPDGVVAINLIEGDPLFGSRIATMASCFQHTYVQVDRTIVLFGTDSGFLRHEDLVSRAAALQAEHQFSFPFEQRAASVKSLRDVERLWHLSQSSKIITDDSGAAGSFPLSADDPLFYKVGRNDLCPCGSGKKFKKCHGYLGERT